MPPEGEQLNCPGLAQLRKDLETVYNSPPTTLAAARLCLGQLAASAAEVVVSLEAPNADQAAPDNEAAWWARAFAGQCRAALDDLMFFDSSTLNSIDKIPTLRELAGLGNQRAGERIADIERLALQLSELARMDYDFLFDPTRHLLAIGYNVGERRRDASFYDLLASEARLCCFVAIAQGQLPQESWFALGRLLTTRRWRADSSFMERFDVRIPDAASGDADVRTHTAGPDL